MRLHQRAYRVLLRAYPPEYRLEYGAPMTQLLADRLRDEGGGLRSVGVWMQVLVDLARTAFSQRMETTMKTLKTGWWRILAVLLSVFTAVAGVGLPFEPEENAGPNWLIGAVLYAIATVTGLALVLAGLPLRRRNRRIGSTMVALGVAPAFPMTIMFWFPPVALVGLLSMVVFTTALIDAGKAPRSAVSVAR